jgi:hypothetical protein
MLNYTKFMALQPTKYGQMTNDKGQLIEFYEHPLRGDEHPVIAVCHELNLAATTDFYELDDMTAEHGEYQPWFNDGQIFYGLL